MLLAIWRFRYFIASAIMGDLRSRYARSRLGLLWHILHPLAQAAIFSIVLAEVLGARLGGINDKAAYPIYLLAGMSAWTLFTDIVNRCMTVFMDYGSALKKIAFPRICLPLIVLGSALLNHLLLLSAIFIVFLFYGRLPSSAWLALPLGAFIIGMFAFGIGITLGVMNVFSRDIGQIMAVALQLWFWVTPIVYPLAVIPDRLRWTIDLNPMAALVSIYQNALVFGQWPSFVTLIFPLTAGIVLNIIAFSLFRRASSELVDAL